MKSTAMKWLITIYYFEENVLLEMKRNWKSNCAHVYELEILVLLNWNAAIYNMENMHLKCINVLK